MCSDVLCCAVLLLLLQADPELINALNRLRLGQMDRRTEMLLSELKRPLPDDGIAATHLYPRKDDVSQRIACRQYVCYVGERQAHRWFVVDRQRAGRIRTPNRLHRLALTQLLSTFVGSCMHAASALILLLLQAAALNKTEYARLSGPEFQFPAIDACEPDVYEESRMHDRLNRNTNAPMLLKLKVGTQVRLAWLLC